MTTPPSAPPLARHLPEGHVRMPSLAIGALSVTLAAGLQLTGILPLLDATLHHLLHGSPSAPHPPAAALWAGTVLLSFGLAFAMLSVPGFWRRAILWITTLALVAGWAPVLVLAARIPEVAAPAVAVAWTGFCALIYASRHQMKVDDSAHTPSAPADPS